MNPPSTDTSPIMSDTYPPPPINSLSSKLEYFKQKHTRIPPIVWVGITSVCILVSLAYTQYRTRLSQGVNQNSTENIQNEQRTQTFSDATQSSTPAAGSQIIEGNYIPTPTPTIKPTSIITIKTPTPLPSTKPTITPTSNPIADYFADGIKVIGAANNSTTILETGSLSTMKVEANFKNNAMIESSGNVRVDVYYDGIHKTTLERAEYGAYSAAFTYVPPVDPGSHTVRMVINEKHIISETAYGNNEQSITYTIIPDSTPPGFTIDGPYAINNQTCMRWINLYDNVSVYTDVWAKWKIDSGTWSTPTSENPYACITAESGTTHTYTVHAEDRRANITELSKTFVAF